MPAKFGRVGWRGSNRQVVERPVVSADSAECCMRESCTSELDELVELMIKNFYQPEKNGLIARSLN